MTLNSCSLELLFLLLSPLKHWDYRGIYHLTLLDLEYLLTMKGVRFHSGEFICAPALIKSFRILSRGATATVVEFQVKP